MGGAPKRMLKFAHYIQDLICYNLPFGHTFENVTEISDRYAMYKSMHLLSNN